MSESIARPKRGRPSGKNRMTLTAKERRARNAKYERVRRNDVEHGLTELAKVIGCNREVTPDSKLLRITYQMIKRSKVEPNSYSTKEELEEQNKNIENEIAKLEEQIKIGEIEEDIKIEEIKEWLVQPSLAVSTQETKSDTTKDQLEEQNKKTQNDIARLEEQIQIAEIENWLLQPF